MIADILNSIVNRSIDAYDNEKPYSFIKFLEFYNQSISTKYIISEYNEYLQQWYEIKNNQISTDVYKQVIQQQYFELLREISLDYSTTEEKRFLSNLVLTEEILNDKNKLNNLLDIILPFYIRKINSICEYYLNKRNDLKLRTTRLLDINSTNDTKTVIKDLIVDELKTNNSLYSINIDDIENIKEVLAVDIEDLFDNNDYFETQTLSTNSNAINYKAFYDYDDAVIDAIRQYPFFLYDNNIFAFSVNPSLTVNDVNYLPLNEFIENTRTGDKNDIIVSLQKTLVERYTGTDYYYISAGTNSEIVSGLLVKADNSILNILNKNLLNTPTFEKDNYDDIRRIGINFQPDKFGLLLYNTNNLRYEVDTDKLSANSVYVFPNPNKYSSYSDPQLIWIINNDKNKLNYTSQYAYGSPKTDPLLQYFYAYFSIEQQQDSLNKDKIVFHDFEQFVGDNIITRKRFDEYGNEYALIKKINYIKPKEYSLNDNINKILNGNMDDFSYYSALAIDTELSSYYYYTLPMGDFGENNFEYNTTTYRKFNYCIDGYYIDVSSLKLSSYLTSEEGWPYFNDISYNVVVDGGCLSTIDNNSVGEYTMSIPGDYNPALYSSLISTEVESAFEASEHVIQVFDGGAFYTKEEYTDEKVSKTINLSNEQQITPTKTPTITERNNMIGDLYVKNVITGEIHKANDALSAIYNKYNINDNNFTTIYNELLTAVTDIDIINNIVLITTPNYIVYDKIVFNNDSIIKSPYSPAYIDKRNEYIDKSSTYFYVDSQNKIAYVQITNYITEYPDLTGGPYYAPVLNLIDTDTLNVDIIKITDKDFVIDNFDWSEISKIRRIDTPKLIFNSMNNLYNMSMICYDYNDIPYLYNMSFINNVDYILLYSNTLYDTTTTTNTMNISSTAMVLYNQSYEISANSTGDYLQIQ